jgi:hypothetical protein
MVAGVSYFWLAPKIFFKQVDTAHDIIDQTYTAQNAIHNYEWFKIQYEKIGATDIQIDNTYITIDDFKDTYGNASTWDFTTKQEYNRLRMTLLGQKNHYESLVADYNANAKMSNKNIFKDKLPFSVDSKMW